MLGKNLRIGNLEIVRNIVSYLEDIFFSFTLANMRVT